MSDNKKTGHEDLPLEPRQQLFVDEYIIDFNATRAAKAAGYSESSAASIASENLTKPNIKTAVDKAVAERRQRLRIDADSVLWMWWQIANADYNELSSVRRVACGFCYDDSPAFINKDKDEDARDVDPSRDPNPDCNICRGEGAPHVHVADTRKLSNAARLVYQGAKETKFGIEVLAADRMKALDNVARHLGMFTDRVDHTSSDGSMSPPQDLTVEVAKAISKKLDDDY